MEKLVDSAKVAEMLGVSRVTVWRLTRSGKLNPVCLGRRLVRYRVSDVEALVRENLKSSQERV